MSESNVLQESPFEKGLRHRVVRIERCSSCGFALSLTPVRCHRCGSADLSWEDTPGTGIVHSVTQVHRAPGPEFQSLLPYTLVLVELEQGPLILGHGVTMLQIGDRVTADFFDHGTAVIIWFIRLEDRL